MMATSFGALCADFYVNLKLALKMELPSDRETLLHLFDRVRRSVPSMNRLRRFEGELALESPRRDPEYRWLALQARHIRSGHVNPQSMTEAYKFHRLVLEMSPFHLSLSPLDIDFMELMFGFDLECKGNHDEVVFEALFAGSPMGEVLRGAGERILDVQPVLGTALQQEGQMQAYFEIKTRHRGRRGQTGRSKHEPLSLFVTVRKYGPVDKVEDLKNDLDILARQTEKLATERLVPHLLAPIARQIASLPG